MLPDPTLLPEGCKFAPRCTHCTEKCRTSKPPLRVENGHTIRCHLYEDMGKEEKA